MKTNENVSESLGYPNLEALIEQPNPDIASMKASQKALEELSKTAKSAKDKGSAKIAVLAYTRFFELFDKLLEVRSKMVEKSTK
ncbi:MAG: hypothetical protein V4534_06695 [Myxococcota bacterium]